MRFQSVFRASSHKGLTRGSCELGNPLLLRFTVRRIAENRVLPLNLYKVSFSFGSKSFNLRLRLFTVLEMARMFLSGSKLLNRKLLQDSYLFGVDHTIPY